MAPILCFLLIHKATCQQIVTRGTFGLTIWSAPPPPPRPPPPREQQRDTKSHSWIKKLRFSSDCEQTSAGRSPAMASSTSLLLCRTPGLHWCLVLLTCTIKRPGADTAHMCFVAAPQGAAPRRKGQVGSWCRE